MYFLAIEFQVLSASSQFFAVRRPAQEVVGAFADDDLKDAEDARRVVASGTFQIDELLQVADAAQTVEAELSGHFGKCKDRDQKNSEHAKLHCGIVCNSKK